MSDGDDKEQAAAAIGLANAAPDIDECHSGHRFAKLADHPTKDGLARCPHCLAIGLDASRAIPVQAEPAAQVIQEGQEITIQCLGKLEHGQYLYAHPRPSLPENVREALERIDRLKPRSYLDLSGTMPINIHSYDLLRAFVREVTGE